MSAINMAIYTPEGAVFSGPVESINAPGREGRFGVLPHHAPMIAALKRGVLRAKGSGRDLFFVTGEGILEISGESVTVLADTAVAAEDAAKAQSLLVS